MFNFASMADIEPGDERNAIQFAQSFFDDLGMPWTWLVGPSNRPSDLAAHLSSAGFAYSHSTPGMALDLRGYDPGEDSEAREVVDRSSLEPWMDVLCAAFHPDIRDMFTAFYESAGWHGLPLRSFYVEEDGSPVASSSVFFAAGVAGIYNVGTVPGARRRGFGERATRASLRAAIEAGLDVAILHSSRMGLPLYERLGFKEYCRMEFYTPPED